MKKGYTLVELLVVIVIIGVLTSIAIVGFGRIQADARDKDRENKASVIAEALEKYYDRNGEYPSVPAVTNSNITDVKNILGISDSGILIMPKASSTTTNSITPIEEAIDKIAYNGESATTPEEIAACQNDITKGCDKFTLKWRNEDGTPGQVDSRHAIRNQESVLLPPKNPIMSVVKQGANTIRGTVSFNMADGAPVCRDGNLEYKILSSTVPLSLTSTSPQWPSNWSASNTLLHPQTAQNNTTYFFYSIARCAIDATAFAVNTNVASGSYFFSDVAATASWSGSNAIGKLTSNYGPVCPSGLTPQYSIQHKVDTSTAGSWPSTADVWQVADNKSVATGASTKVSFRGKVRCNNPATPTVFGTESAMSTIDFVVSAPATPALSRDSDGPGVNWNWSTSCPQTTTQVPVASYGGNFTDKPYTGNFTPSGTNSHYFAGAFKNGFTYEFGVSVSCGTPSTKILTSGRASNTIPASFNDIQIGQGRLFSYEYNGNTNRIRARADVYSDYAGYCPTGTNRYITGQFQHNSGGVGTDSNNAWYTNYPQSYWPSGNLTMMTGQILAATSSGLNGNDSAEFRAEVFCHNPTLGTRSNPEGRFMDRYGTLKIYGYNEGGTVKPYRYQLLCNGMSNNGGGIDPGWLICETSFNNYGAVRERNTTY